MALLCGRYEGFDERVHEHFADDEVSIGRYVLAGGELPAMVVADVLMRKLPGALGHEQTRRRGVVQPACSRGCRSTRTTPGRRPTGAGRCPRSWSPATTSGSAAGGSSRAALAPSSSNEARSRYHSADRAAPGPGSGGFFSQCEDAMSSVIDSIERAQLRKGLPSFDPGDRVRVHFQVIEGNRRRTQVFEGIVLKRQGSGARETFTVRKQSFGVGVERTFPLHSPKIEKLEIAARGDVRRAKLYYLRGRIGKAARVAERRWGIDEELISAPAAAGRSRRRSTPRASARQEAVRKARSADRGRGRRRGRGRARGRGERCRRPPPRRSRGAAEAEQPE